MEGVTLIIPRSLPSARIPSPVPTERACPRSLPTGVIAWTPQYPDHAMEGRAPYTKESLRETKTQLVDSFEIPSVKYHPPTHILFLCWFITTLYNYIRSYSILLNLRIAGDANLAYEIHISRGIAMSEFRDPFKPSTPYIEVDDDDQDLESDDSDVPAVAFPGHRDTLAILHLRRHHEPVIPPAVSVPSELLQNIYQHLTPLDFHAARHTCKKWFLASLDKTLLQKMTCKAGCSRAANEDSQRLIVRTELRRLSLERRRSLEHEGQHIQDYHTLDIDPFISDEWLLSKRLATEAQITPGRHMRAGPIMSIREQIDFSPLQSTASVEPPHIAKHTVSSCGRFDLVICGQILRVYALWPNIRPITSLCCRRRILAASMDTSSNRYSVAVLLEDRVGMCWDLDTEILAAFPAQHGYLGPRVAPELVTLTQEPETASKSVVFETTGFPSDVPSDGSHASAVYEQLGGPDDPPRSVAICPQRKCVAFGCRMGIELHWVDALTGGDLSRWFPLAAPSDFLYFLPQRPGIDSTKKLRLISSAGGPFPLGRSRVGGRTADEDRLSMTRLFFGSLPIPSATTAIVQSMWSARSDASESQGVLRTVDCDHYRAIPLSDGVHVLFTDPISGLLCLGSDAPLGGPTKLLRKFVFLPPGYVSTTTKLLPTCYTAAQELPWGIRVAAIYMDGSLVLFNVPSDCFEHVKEIRNTPDIWDEEAGVFAQSDLLMDVLMDIQRTSDEAMPDNPDAELHSQTHTHRRPFRTIQVPGVRIATTEGEVDDVAVSCQSILPRVIHADLHRSYVRKVAYVSGHFSRVVLQNAGISCVQTTIISNCDARLSTVKSRT